MKDKQGSWNIYRLAFIGGLFGMAYSIVRLSWGAGEPTYSASSLPYLIGAVVGGGIGGAFLATLVGALRNYFTR